MARFYQKCGMQQIHIQLKPLQVDIIMILNKFISPFIFRMTIALRNGFFKGKPQHLIPRNSVQMESIRPKKQKIMEQYESQADIELAQSITSLNLKDMSVKIHHLLVEREKSPIFWSTVENQFLNRLVPTTDPVTIRSYSKILYALSKAKKATANYETKISLILPFATPQSLTTMVTACSRIAPYSQEFGYIVEKLYYKRKDELKPREKVSINYSLANNGRKVDISLIDSLDSFNCIQTVTMLRCYDLSEMMTAQILEKALKKLMLIQRQINALDISDIINIYLKHGFVSEPFEILIKQSYNALKRHINDICIEKIWMHIPQNLNNGKLKISFVEDVITTILILRKGDNMGQVIWKKIQPTFNTIDNIELKLKLEKIY